jgi:hypothetical protein
MYWEKVIKENNEESLRNIIFTKAEYYIETYIKAGKKEQSYKNLETLLKQNPKYELEIKYILAKIGLENDIQIEKSKKYLIQVEKAFRENRFFNKVDIEKLKRK